MGKRAGLLIGDVERMDCDNAQGGEAGCTTARPHSCIIESSYRYAARRDSKAN
jgi:hypothetical protein